MPKKPVFATDEEPEIVSPTALPDLSDFGEPEMFDAAVAGSWMRDASMRRYGQLLSIRFDPTGIVERHLPEAIHQAVMGLHRPGVLYAPKNLTARFLREGCVSLGETDSEVVLVRG